MKDKILKLLRDLRDNTPCDEESTNCGCEKFDEIIDLVDQLDLVNEKVNEKIKELSSDLFFEMMLELEGTEQYDKYIIDHGFYTESTALGQELFLRIEDNIVKAIKSLNLDLSK